MSIETVNPEPVAVTGESHSIDLQGQSKLHMSCDVRKPIFQGVRPGPTQTGLGSLRKWLEA